MLEVAREDLTCEAAGPHPLKLATNATTATADTIRWMPTPNPAPSAQSKFRRRRDHAFVCPAPAIFERPSNYGLGAPRLPTLICAA